MCDVIKEVTDKVPRSFVRLNVFLAALMAIPAMHLCPAIQANFFFPFL